jgi:hypothetical protein
VVDSTASEICQACHSHNNAPLFNSPYSVRNSLKRPSFDGVTTIHSLAILLRNQTKMFCGKECHGLGSPSRPERGHAVPR